MHFSDQLLLQHFFHEAHHRLVFLIWDKLEKTGLGSWGKLRKAQVFSGFELNVILSNEDFIILKLQLLFNV